MDGMKNKSPRPARRIENARTPEAVTARVALSLRQHFLSQPIRSVVFARHLAICRTREFLVQSLKNVLAYVCDIVGGMSFSNSVKNALDSAFDGGFLNPGEERTGGAQMASIDGAAPVFSFRR